MQDIQRVYDLSGTLCVKGLRVDFNLLSPNPIKWSNTLKQFVVNSRRIV